MKFISIGLVVLAAVAVLPLHFLAAQTLPIAIDGQFNDWTTAAVSFEDGVDAASGNDLLRMSVANDEKYLFIRFEVSQEVVLTDNNDLTLFIDGDNNQLTGKSINGIGAELELRLGDRDGIFYFGNSQWYHDLSDVKFHSLPTFGGKVFEIAIGRSVKPNGSTNLFTGNKIRLYFQNGTAGDKMPNTGQTFTYTFSSNPSPVYQPIDLQRLSPDHLRLMTWNVLSDGLLDIVRKPHFQRVLVAIQPDIVTFNECWNMTAAQAVTFMNTALPLGNGQNWKAVKLDAGNITLSRYPILQNWYFYPGHRLTASLIDLPDAVFDKDILVINGHLRCCSANSERQLEADAFVKFILDAKSPGGVIDLPENTPFVLSGDMNLVGWQQQYTTLTTGNIVNTGVFGNGGPLDWDGSPLLDVVSLQTDQRMAYTWHSDGSQYPPSRLDYHICSNSVLQVKKAFTLQTEIMPQARLTGFGLQLNDTGTASDHLPKVTDFVVTELTQASEVETTNTLVRIYPNPAQAVLYLEHDFEVSEHIKLLLFNATGQVVRQWSLLKGQQTQAFSVEGFVGGMYFWVLESEGFHLGTGKINVLP